MLFVVKRILIHDLSKKENAKGMTFCQRKYHRFTYNHLKNQFYVLSEIPPLCNKVMDFFLDKLTHQKTSNQLFRYISIVEGLKQNRMG